MQGGRSSYSCGDLMVKWELEPSVPVLRSNDDNTLTQLFK